MAALAFTGFFLNLFNLLPVTPLDGGRAMAALAPWMWFVGLGAIVALALAFPNPIILIIAVVGAFDVYGRWTRRRRGGDETRAVLRRARARPRAGRAGLPRAHRAARGGHGRHPPAALDPEASPARAMRASVAGANSVAGERRRDPIPSNVR